jgi:hypothetical protein
VLAGLVPGRPGLDGPVLAGSFTWGFVAITSLHCGLFRCLVRP